ncbi:MAG: beta-galactosidase family protein [Eubacteriales bacterium]|nr:beta-galactosidase family protein [Eubacteriales bacterium]
MALLTYDEKQFYLDGKPYRILSGAMHYFRIPREYWRDRLLKLKECGFNTLETYTCWNLHEPEEGRFDFSGMLDIAAYIDLAAELGLNVILRPGPYICSEWDFGGLPAWLLKYDKIALRCNDPAYIEKVRRYYHALFDEVGDRLSTRGGNVVMVQIENEYGSYGNDHDYMRAVVDIYRECGVDCLLFTSDGACDWMLNGGTLPEFLSVANFGSRAKMNFDILNDFRRKGNRSMGPTMCGEFWSGWFDHWYEEHHVRPTSEIIDCFREMLDYGASLNFYMFHGGTNFGFTNGANHTGVYQPTITSYDYNAPLTEAGDITPTYLAMRALVEEYEGIKLPPLTVKNSEKAAYGKVALTESAPICRAVRETADPIKVPAPVYMEEIGQYHGFAMYSTVIHGPISGVSLDFDVLHDRATVFMDGKFCGIFERDRRRADVPLNLDHGQSVRLDIFVEDMGRVNYGPKLRDRKGAVGIRFGQQYHFGWEMTPFHVDNLSGVTYDKTPDGAVEGTYLLRGTLTIDGEPKDTFVQLDGFHHGIVLVNGFNLGRYYLDAGPQKTLYCPAPMLKSGDNEILVLETDGYDRAEIAFVDTPDLG